MEEKNSNQLDDLIIQSQKPSSMKKLLLASATLLLVLILIILVTKSLVQTDTKPKNSLVLPPEPTTAPAPQLKKEPLFQDVPIQEEQSTDRSVENVIAKAKQTTENHPENSYVNNEKSSSHPPRISEVKPKPVTKPKNVSKPKPTPKPKYASSKPKKTVTGHYFIQVGAFFRYPPSRKFLATIKKEGLDYIIIDGIKKGTPYKKVLVGPYPSRTKALKDLPRIKRRINQNAYITRK